MRVKNIYGEKSNLFAYLRFCAFCAFEEKKIENRKLEKWEKSPQGNVNVLGSVSMQI